MDRLRPVEFQVASSLESVCPGCRGMSRESSEATVAPCSTVAAAAAASVHCVLEQKPPDGWTDG